MAGRRRRGSPRSVPGAGNWPSSCPVTVRRDVRVREICGPDCRAADAHGLFTSASPCATGTVKRDRDRQGAIEEAAPLPPEPVQLIRQVTVTDAWYALPGWPAEGCW